MYTQLFAKHLQDYFFQKLDNVWPQAKRLYMLLNLIPGIDDLKRVAAENLVTQEALVAQLDESDLAALVSLFNPYDSDADVLVLLKSHFTLNSPDEEQAMIYTIRNAIN